MTKCEECKYAAVYKDYDGTWYFCHGHKPSFEKTERDSHPELKWPRTKPESGCRKGKDGYPLVLYQW